MKNIILTIAVAITLIVMSLALAWCIVAPCLKSKKRLNFAIGDSVLIFYDKRQWVGSVLRPANRNGRLIVRRWNHEITRADTTYTEANNIELHPRVVFEREHDSEAGDKR